MKPTSVLLWLASHAALGSAILPRHPAARLAARTSQATTYTEYFFDQAIDHFPDSPRYAHHTNGTFKQRYFIETKYYKAGGPVFLYLAGEGPIDNDRHLNNSLINHLMQQFSGIGVVLENRYYGTSVPFNSSSTDELAYLTTEQVIADFDVFARRAELPGVENVNAPSTPWFLYGGSYPGALSAFTKKTYPDTFYGAISSSGVIHAQLEYPNWYAPIQLLAPQNCVASVNNIVDKMDSLVKSGNTAAIEELKEIFGLSALKDIRDFAQTIAFPIGGPFEYPTFTWQEIYWNPRVGKQDFFNFCRNVTDINAPANNTAIDKQLARYTDGEPWKNLGNYAAYVKRVVLPLCPDGQYDSSTCFGTQNASWWADTTSTAERSYLYTTCTEVGAYQATYPYGEKSLLSRVINATYTQQWCDWAFPPGKYNSIPATPDFDKWNVYGSFNFSAKNLLFIDGSADPWRDLCYHSTQVPQRYWTDDHPEHLINGAGHVWDLITYEDVSTEPQFMRETTYLELSTVERWLKEFKESKNSSFSRMI